MAGQVDYYRRRAGEYDVTAYGDVMAARARIARLVAELRPAGSVLEIACGTGLWTEALAGLADAVTAIDAAPEAVEIARGRVRPASVTFEVADVFSWDPGTRFDVIFFSAWLSHVPMSRFGQFWQLLGGLLAGNGRVLFIDEHVDECGKEAYVAGRDEVVERRLRDGSSFRVIKNFVDPEEMELRLRRLGWDCVIRRDGSDWVCGEARLARQPGLHQILAVSTAQAGRQPAAESCRRSRGGPLPPPAWRSTGPACAELDHRRAGTRTAATVATPLVIDLERFSNGRWH